VNSDSARQARLMLQLANKILDIGQGRPVNLNSARQIRLAELEAKKAANGGVIKRGRPKMIKSDNNEIAA
jgi:hypothetical protein